MTQLPLSKTELMVALDLDDPSRAYDLAHDLRELSLIFKVGLELFVAGGPEVVRRLVGEGGRVFLDLKLHDIPNTMSKAVESAGRLGAEFLTIHMVAGEQALRTCVEVAPSSLCLLGVSVLTSFNDKSWEGVTRRLGAVGGSIAATVENFARDAHGLGLGGMVCSPHEVREVRNVFPRGYFVTPGIRPSGGVRGDQERVATPSEAALWGASGIVVGRPIVQSSDPLGAAKKILEELQGNSEKR